MRVLLSTYGSRGDVEPLVGLAVQLRALGADVRMCAPPDEEFAELLAGADVPMVPFGRPWRSWVRPSAPEERTRRVAEFIDAQYDTVATAAEGCDVLVATAMSHFVAQSVAEKLMAGGGPDPGSVVGVGGSGCRADRRVDPARRSPTPGRAEGVLDAGAPPVYVGFGSMRVPQDSARAAIEAIRAQGCRALVAHGWADLDLIDDRDDCFVIGEVNQQTLFGRVAAVVHHGGAGTTTTAARAGTPQVVVAQAGDQLYWTGRVVELGIGAAHDGPTPTTESLSAALRTALTPETQARATAVAGTIRTDGAAVAATLLVDAVRRERHTA